MTKGINQKTLLDLKKILSTNTASRPSKSVLYKMDMGTSRGGVVICAKIIVEGDYQLIDGGKDTINIVRVTTNNYQFNRHNGHLEKDFYTWDSVHEFVSGPEQNNRCLAGYPWCLKIGELEYVQMWPHNHLYRFLKVIGI